MRIWLTLHTNETSQRFRIILEICPPAAAFSLHSWDRSLWVVMFLWCQCVSKFWINVWMFYICIIAIEVIQWYWLKLTARLHGGRLLPRTTIVFSNVFYFSELNHKAQTKRLPCLHFFSISHIELRLSLSLPSKEKKTNISSTVIWP